MNSWAVLDRSDPAPGDVAGTRGLGESLLRQASDIEAQTARLRSLSADRGALQMAGDYAASYSETLELLPGDLSKLGLAYHRCGTALTAFAETLNEAKSRAGNALRSGQDADLRYRAAVRQLQLLLPASASLTLGLGMSFDSMNLATATIGLDASTQAQIQVAVRQAQNAGQDLDRARGLADQAATLRNDAEETCVKQINAALDESGIKNKSWLQREFQQFKANFTWDTFIADCRKEALVMGIAAVIFSGPVGWSFAAMALAAGAFVFADGVRQYGDGEIGLGELALDGLYVLPAGGVGSGAKLLRMTRLLRGGGTEAAETAEAVEIGGSFRADRPPSRPVEERPEERDPFNETPQSAEQIQDWLPDVNPGKYVIPLRQENCGGCTVAVMQRWRGESAVAGLNTHSVEEMERATGVKQIPMSPSEIADSLRAKGKGSMAVVGIDRSGGYPGHWFNAYYDGENVVTVDGQSGMVSGWPPDFSQPGHPVTGWDAGVLNDG